MLLEVKNISYLNIIKNISFSLEEGKVCAIVGKSGAGKSTVLELVADLISPDEGKITRKGSLGYLFQDSDLQLFENSVYKEVGFALRDKKLKKDELDALVKAGIEDVNLSPDLLQSAPYSLSGGEKKRVALASILIRNPDLIILDEPTVGLDYPNLKAIEKIIRDLKAKGRGILFSSHDYEFISEVCDFVFHIDKGEMIFYGEKDAFFDRFPEKAEFTSLSGILGLGSVSSYDNLVERLKERLL